MKMIVLCVMLSMAGLAPKMVAAESNFTLEQACLMPEELSEETITYILEEVSQQSGTSYEDLLALYKTGGAEVLVLDSSDYKVTIVSTGQEYIVPNPDN